MKNLQNATLARSADGLFLLELPRSVYVNPNMQYVLQPAAPIGNSGLGTMVRNALNAFDDATQVPHMLIGLDRW